MADNTLRNPLHSAFDTETGIATLTLNKPAVRNAFDDVLVQELLEKLNILVKNAAVRLLILRGTGDHFSAGADLHWMRRMVKQSRTENQADALALAHLMHRLYTFPTPTLVAIQGSVFGGAIGLVACCDIAIAADNGLFCFSETQLGLLPAVIAPYILQAIGERAAKRYMLTAEPFDVKEAYRLGLVHEHIPIDHLNARLQHYTQKILKNSPKALLKTKAMIYALNNTAFKNPLSKMEYTANLIADIRTTPEAQQRLTAFLEKRDTSS